MLCAVSRLPGVGADSSLLRHPHRERSTFPAVPRPIPTCRTDSRGADKGSGRRRARDRARRQQAGQKRIDVCAELDNAAAHEHWSEIADDNSYAFELGVQLNAKQFHQAKNHGQLHQKVAPRCRPLTPRRRPQRVRPVPCAGRTRPIRKSWPRSRLRERYRRAKTAVLFGARQQAGEKRNAARREENTNQTYGEFALGSREARGDGIDRDRRRQHAQQHPAARSAEPESRRPRRPRVQPPLFSRARRLA